MEKIHKDNPTLRFGEVVQKAMDRKKMSTNYDLHNCSSKEIHTAILELDNGMKLMKEKKGRKLKDDS